MSPFFRSLVPALLLAAAAATVARAQDAGFDLLDRGRLVAFQDGTPIATERFLYQRNADSLVIIAHAERRQRARDGTIQPYSKSMTLVARADDFGLLGYNSTEYFDGHEIRRTITPDDTLLTVNTQADDRGGTNLVDRPPGRFFAIDPGIFSLFDIAGRNLHGRLYGPRPIELVMLGEDTRISQAIVAPAGNDTVEWGARRIVTERVTLSDSSGVFTLWLSPEGHLLRLENPALGLVVTREPPPLPPLSKRRKPKAR